MSFVRHKGAAVGISDHYASAVFVSVAVTNGEPLVVDRRKVQLLEPGLPASPYHHETLSMDTIESEKLVKSVQASANLCAEKEMERLISDGKREIVAVVLREPPLPQLPASVAEAHASYHVTNRADGMIYHHALCLAARKYGIPVEMIRRGQERARAAGVLGTSEDQLEHWLAGWRKTMGPPWQKDHQDATARAIAGLGKHYKKLSI